MAQTVAVTLPNDVLEWLHGIHQDPAWAIVSLFEKAKPERHGELWAEPREVELARIGARRALIVVDPQLFNRLTEVAAIPLSPRRAFLALKPGSGMAALELAVTDYLEDLPHGKRQARLARVRQQLRELRRDTSLRFESRSIIVVESRRPSSARLAGAGRGRKGTGS